VGMHSMNVGLREGRDLAHVLTGILKGPGKAADLERYGTERLAEWRRLQGLEGVPQPLERCDPWVRGHLESFVPCTPASGAELRYLLAQLGLDIPRG